MNFYSAAKSELKEWYTCFNHPHIRYLIITLKNMYETCGQIISISSRRRAEPTVHIKVKTLEEFSSNLDQMFTASSQWRAKPAILLFKVKVMIKG